MRLLIVEDNLRLANLLSERLCARGFHCDQAQDLASATARLGGGDYDIIILDRSLPDGDGLEWLRTEKAIREVPPTVILTSRNALDDRVAGLDGGAEDYLAKPFEFEELLARLRVMARRSNKDQSAVISVGPLHFDTDSRTAHFGGTAMQMSRREADLLELLMRQSGTVVSRSHIESTLYGSPGLSMPNAVEAVVSRLRRKMESSGGRDMLHTVRGLGYLLRADPW